MSRLLQRDGVAMIGPNAGEMAEAGEAGIGRMAEPLEIAAAAERLLRPPQPRPLAGKRILITAGPTHEPIDPVRYIANRSSGKQGFAIAAAAQAAGADVTLISGPVELDDPPGVAVMHVESARDMLQRVEAALPVDIAIFAAAVADWRVAHEGEQKLKKTASRHAAAAARGKSGYSGDDLDTEGRAAAAGDRLCRRDRTPDRERQGKTRPQGLRLDRRQRRLAGDRRDGRRSQHRSSADRAMATNIDVEFLAGDDQGGGRQRTDRRMSPKPWRSNERIVSTSVKIEVRQLPHGEGLALPAYQSALCRRPRSARRGSRRCADRPCARKICACSHRTYRSRCRRATRHRSVRAPGLAAKHGVTVLNAPGTVDADYRGEIGVLLINHGDVPFTIRRGERIAQMVIASVVQAELVPVATLSATARGSGGFGSTGR